MTAADDAEYFPSPETFRAWLERHHADREELWVGFHRVSTGRPSLTWREAVDEALCFGWIDGVRKRVDETRHVIRFTPRRPRSIWSAVNIARVKVLTDEKRMRPAGVTAYAARRENKSGIYAYEQRRDRLEEPYAGLLKKNKAASAFFEAQPPGYRKVMGWFIVSAKREETRLSRLKILIDACERKERLR